VKDLLVLLGKRVHELHAAKKWSQEEFAHISGLHRTYMGQIERGEKNISFANLLKVSGVLGVTMSELLAGLEDSTWPERDRPGRASVAKAEDSARPMFEVHRLVKRLKLQRAAMDRTVELLEERALDSGRSQAGRPPVKRARRK
jgi:transcriptional regulator with XRE-family HTH domain